MKFGYLLASLLSLAGTAFAQSEAFCDENGLCFQRFVEPGHGLSVGAAFPRDAGRDEFIGEIVAPVSVRWAGYALGGSMRGNILVVVWPNGGGFVFSTRMAADYVLPTIYSGPSISQLPGSSVNGTHWKFVFRCQGCTRWTAPDGTAGAIDASNQVQSWALSTKDVNNPSDAGSSFSQHTDFGTWGQSIGDARSDNYDTYLSGSGSNPNNPPAQQTTGTGALTVTGGTITGTGTITTGLPTTGVTRVTGTVANSTGRLSSTGRGSSPTDTASSAKGSFDYLGLGTVALLALFGGFTLI